MRLKVELTWWNGIVADGEPAWSEPEYDLIDADTGRDLADHAFSSCVELETYIAAHYPDCERWVPPPPPPEDAAKLEKVFGLIEKLPPDQFNPRALRPFLAAQLYQSRYPPETVARIRRLLGLPA
ncbi:MAG: hypothetical protein Q7T25_03315 [Sideroxyarcus sp.]|nr:hypothetical protein [Sideroxyarcus sp.]